MKKITDNSIFNKISLPLNIGILIVFIISMFLLNGFDRVNIEYVFFQSVYDKANEGLRTAQQPTRADSIRVATYQYRLDTLRAKEMPKDKKQAEALTETIERVTKNLEDHLQVKHVNDSIVEAKMNIYIPVKEKYDHLTQEVANKKGTFKTVFIICLVLLFIKIMVFAFWNYKNALNVRNIVAWSKKGSSPFWAILGWFIPAYNFIKPLSFLNENIEDTEYILEDKNIKERNDKKSSDQELLRGIWWGSFLVAVVLMMIFIFNTFFQTGALFMKLNHNNVIFASILIWAIYLLLDSIICINYNKLTKQLFDKASKL